MNYQRNWFWYQVPSSQKLAVSVYSKAHNIIILHCSLEIDEFDEWKAENQAAANEKCQHGCSRGLKNT